MIQDDIVHYYTDMRNTSYVFVLKIKYTESVKKFRMKIHFLRNYFFYTNRPPQFPQKFGLNPGGISTLQCLHVHQLFIIIRKGIVHRF